jgi:hypothetical protein
VNVLRFVAAGPGLRLRNGKWLDPEPLRIREP